MINTPAHKQTSPDKAPGQVVNPLAWLHKTSGQIVNDVTLADYIARKEKAYKPKLTFDQWWAQRTGLPEKIREELTIYSDPFVRAIWKEAQENA